MKKLMFILASILTLTLTSCGTQFGLAYSVAITGDGDGKFEVTFPQGSYAMDGTAALDLQLGDTIMFNDSAAYVTKAEVLERGKAKELKAMKEVNDSIAEKFNAVAAEGTYDIWIKGFVKELGTGLTFSVDRRLTNRDVKALKKASVNLNDPYPFIK